MFKELENTAKSSLGPDGCPNMLLYSLRHQELFDSAPLLDINSFYPHMKNQLLAKEAEAISKRDKNQAEARLNLQNGSTTSPLAKTPQITIKNDQPPISSKEAM